MFKNDTELQAAMLADFKIMIDELSVKLLEELKKFIQTKVYNAGIPSVDHGYHRNYDQGGLMSEYEKIDATISGNTVHSSIDPNASSLVEHDSGNNLDFTHGSEYFSITDIRDFLVVLINEGKSGPLFGDGFWTQPRPFFDEMENFLKTPQADIIIESIMTAHGIKWVKI